MKVQELISELKQFPPNADCYAYEGEITGIVINYQEGQGYIICSETDDGHNGDYLFSPQTKALARADAET